MKKFISLTFVLGSFFASLQFSAQQKEPESAFRQESDADVMTAYPNPARDVLYLKVKNPALKVKTVTFYSIIGIQAAQFSVNMNSAEIRLDKLKPGKYLIRYTLSDNSQKVTQIVKQ